VNRMQSISLFIPSTILSVLIILRWIDFNRRCDRIQKKIDAISTTLDKTAKLARSMSASQKPS